MTFLLYDSMHPTWYEMQCEEYTDSCMFQNPSLKALGSTQLPGTSLILAILQIPTSLACCLPFTPEPIGIAYPKLGHIHFD